MRVLVAGLLLSLSIAMTGCVSEPVTEEGLVGTYTNGDTVLVLSADGTFTLTDAPAYTLFTVSESWADSDGSTRDGYGDWSLEPDTVRLNNETPPGYGEQLFVESSDVLYFGIDLGSSLPRCFQLVKDGSDQTAKGPDDCFLRG